MAFFFVRQRYYML